MALILAVLAPLTATSCATADTPGPDTEPGSDPVRADGGQRDPDLDPIAVASGGYVVPTGTEIVFSAAGSRAAEGEIVRYRWDFDDDGTFDVDTDQPEVTYAYPDPYDGVAVLEVTDSQGRVALTTTDVLVDDRGLADRLPLDVEEVTVASNGDGTATVTWVAHDLDRADGYSIRDHDGEVIGLALGGGDGSVLVEEELLGPEVTVFAVNDYGLSAGVTVSLDR